MAALSACTPGNGAVVLQALSGGNPERASTAEWTVLELSKQCAALCNKPCSQQLIGVTLRSTLMPKGLVASHKKDQKVLLWSLTEEARPLLDWGCALLERAASAQGRRLAEELAPLAATSPDAAARALRRVKSAPRASPPQDVAAPRACHTCSVAQTPPACSRCGGKMRCCDPACPASRGSSAEG